MSMPMSGNLATPTKSAAAPSSGFDMHMLAHVEKWMTMIREIRGAPQSAPHLSAESGAKRAAPAKE
jgi:hypothetical protein